MRYWLISVRQENVALPRLYKCQSQTRPTVPQLREYGANIVPARGDETLSHAVPTWLWHDMPATWIRPFNKALAEKIDDIPVPAVRFGGRKRGIPITPAVQKTRRGK